MLKEDIKTLIRKERAAYAREWRKKNPQKSREAQERYWIRKIEREKREQEAAKNGNDQ